MTSTPSTTPALLAVIQIDRDAAADIVDWQQSVTAEWTTGQDEDVWRFFAIDFADGIRKGIWDSHDIVQAYARHRLAATPQPAQPQGSISAVDAFELGYCWRSMLHGQVLEDSRAVGRTLGCDLFEPIADAINAAEKQLGFNPFQTSDLGIVQAKRIIRAALTQTGESAPLSDLIREANDRLLMDYSIGSMRDTIRKLVAAIAGESALRSNIINLMDHYAVDRMVSSTAVAARLRAALATPSPVVEPVRYDERVEYEERILAAEMATVRAERALTEARELARADKDRRIEIALKMLAARFPVILEMSSTGQTEIINAMEDYAQAMAVGAAPVVENKGGVDDRAKHKVVNRILGELLAPLIPDLIERIKVIFDWEGEYVERDLDTGKWKLNDKGCEEVKAQLGVLKQLAQRLNLRTSLKLIGRRLGYPGSLPQTVDEFGVIQEVLEDELASRLFLSVPDHLSPYWEKDDLLSPGAKVAFPNATAELRGAGNAHAASLPTGSVFYSMRAVEHGLRALASEVGLTFDIQQWQNIIDQIQAKLDDMRKGGIPGLDKAAKDARLQFLSEAAKEFAYFKDGWRNYVAHAKVPYTEHQALTVLTHVADFIERLSAQLKEAL